MKMLLNHWVGLIFFFVIVMQGCGSSSGTAKVSKYAYVVNSSSGNVSQFTINASGGLTAMTPATVPAETSPNSVTTDPTGRYAYVANAISNTISQYTIGADGSFASSDS